MLKQIIITNIYNINAYCLRYWTIHRQKIHFRFRDATAIKKTWKINKLQFKVITNCWLLFTAIYILTEHLWSIGKNSNCFVSLILFNSFDDGMIDLFHLSRRLWSWNSKKENNTVVSNHVNSDHVPSFSCLDVWTNRQATSGVYAITVTTSAYHSRICGRL